tara:strand:- start:219 stop:647 length:429 start_codon:yes stop_codon:yes gene_type:complete
MSTYQDIHSALTQSLIDLNVASLGTLPIAYEGQEFDPETDVSGDIFIDESFMFSQQESLSKATLDEVRGIYQLTVYQRANLGLSNALATVDAIIDNYVHNNNFTNGVTKIVIVNSGRDVGRTDGGWYSIPLSIIFKTDKLRA